jgi:hypothetical protein
MKEYKANEFTLDKMRNLILQTKLCREDKNCGGCTMVNFCAIWNNRWPDINAQRDNGLNLEIYAEWYVKDVPVLALDRIANAVDKAFDKLLGYMDSNDLYFNDDYTAFKQRSRKH